MIPLAIIEGKVIFVLIALIVGAINAWLEKKKKDSAGNSPQPPTPRTTAPRTAESESEQARLNRFLQALGVPQQPAKTPPTQRAAPQPARPQPVVPAAIRQRDSRAQERKVFVKPVQKIARLVQPGAMAAEEMPRAVRIEEAATSIERISGEFSTMNVRVAMPPVQTLENPAHLATANAGTTALIERGGNPLVASLRRTLTDPTEIRAAFLAAELLGPPRGLQR